MASTVFTDGSTLTAAAWFNDVNTVTYTLFGNGSAYTGALTLGAAGNIAVNTNKFTVAAASGNTVIAGTLGVAGVFSVTASLSSFSSASTAGVGVDFVSTDTGGRDWRIISSGSASGGGAGHLLIYDATGSQIIGTFATTGFSLASGTDLQLGRAYSAGVVAATGTIAIKDSSGTSYNVLVHT